MSMKNKEWKDASSHQLLNWKDDFKKFSLLARDPDGIRAQDLNTSLSVGPRGPILLSDVDLLKNLQGFARKNLPPRVMSKKGTGAYGYFEVTKDITEICGADIFKQVGQKTEVFVRFATGGNVIGIPDGHRGIYTGSIKHYTKEGNWDLLCTQLPVFLVRDQFLFISAMNCRINPVTGLPNTTGMWDFYTSRPETAHQVLREYSNYGIPGSYRTMNLFPISVFKMVNQDGDYKFVRFTLRQNQYEEWKKTKYLTDAEAAERRNADRDFLTKDLFNAIANGAYPSWKLMIQVMDPNDVEEYRQIYKWDPFDPTKKWPSDGFPLQEIGKYVLDKNVTNQFNEVEQAAFNPANMPPGIEAAQQDRVLQGRIFAYRDAQVYRVGGNVSQLPVNSPKGLQYKFRTYSRDMVMNSDTIQGGAPNYYPNSFDRPEVSPILPSKPEKFSGVIGSYDNGSDDNFTQAYSFYENLSEEEKLETAGNIARACYETREDMRERVIKFWENVSQKLSDDIREALQTLDS